MTLEQRIGKRIRIMRKAKGYTQQTLAEAVGISPTYLSEIERGVRIPRIEKLVLIINVLQCSADDIFLDVIHYGRKVKASKLETKIEKLPEHCQVQLLAIIEAYIQNIKGSVYT